MVIPIATCCIMYEPVDFVKGGFKLSTATSKKAEIPESHAAAGFQGSPSLRLTPLIPKKNTGCPSLGKKLYTGHVTQKFLSGFLPAALRSSDISDIVVYIR